ncbi:MAG TPA: FAD-dependent oxidoreductase [Methylococcaceae bacterium]|jgi:glycine oxidase|nr:FAD-dependent oxidoreductase [Methylococcaceae bacterium]HIA45119.1 FAD-dependent oxidoreductase [Methylococcaceae bacterium]
MQGTPDITLIGGGIMGLLSARELALAGLTVTVLERQKIGREASWAGGGIMLPLYPWRQDASITTLVNASLTLYPALTETLHGATGIDPEYLTSGLLITENPDYQAAQQWCQRNHTPVESAPESLLSRLNGPFDHPLWLPDIAQLRNPLFIKALTADLHAKKVTLIEDCVLQGVRCKNNRITVLTTSQGALPVNHLALTTGAWSGKLWQTLWPSAGPTTLKVQPLKGQMLIFDAPPGLLAPMILAGDRYLIPRKDGKILAGSTVEKMGFDKTTTTPAKAALTDFALNLLPDLKPWPITHHWAGLRPGSPNGIPIIGLHPTINNLSINCGHGRSGLIMAPASARLLTDLICQRTPIVDPNPYQLNAQTL